MIKNNVLVIGSDSRLRDLIGNDKTNNIYWCDLGVNFSEKNIKFIKVCDCKKIINLIDLIVVDLKTEKEEQYKDLKEVFRIILNSNLKPSVKLVRFNKDNQDEYSDQNRLYQNLIENYLEGMIKLKNLRSETVTFN